MAEETKRYTTREIERLFERLAAPEDEQFGDEIEVMVELNVKATFLLYQSVDSETGKSRRSFAVRFYHENSEEDDISYSLAAEIEDIDTNDHREIEFDEVAELLQIDPDKPVWELTVEPEGLESDDQ